MEREFRHCCRLSRAEGDAEPSGGISNESLSLIRPSLQRPPCKYQVLLHSIPWFIVRHVLEFSTLPRNNWTFWRQATVLLRHGEEVGVSLNDEATACTMEPSSPKRLTRMYVLYLGVSCRLKVTGDNNSMVNKTCTIVCTKISHFLVSWAQLVVLCGWGSSKDKAKWVVATVRTLGTEGYLSFADF